MLHDWHQFHADTTATLSVVDSRRRLQINLTVFMALLLLVFARVVQLEVSQGSAFRAEAIKPLQREKSLPGVRGRILARDGTVLACDQEVLAVALHYRYLEQPPDARWLRTTARRKLSSAQRKDPDLLAAEEGRVLRERTDLFRRLIRMCELSPDAWNRRVRRIQARVERIAESVRRRRGTDVTVADELDYHVIAEDVPLSVVAEIEGRPEMYPGVKIVTRSRRSYPYNQLAAHVLGHLGPVTKEELDDSAVDYRAEDYAGRMGLERFYERLLRGRCGTAVELTDHGGRVLSSHHRREPSVGRDLVLTLDPSLQAAAESLLDSALQRRAIHSSEAGPVGGAIVVISVFDGALCAAASAPRFDPNVFVGNKTDRRAALLTDPAHPLFDRVSRMAIPPGSVFKTVSAVALLQSAVVDPQESFFCRGYLHEPDRQRCKIYRDRGVGHGEVTLGDALAQSCNVFFFHHAGELGAGPLADWAWRFGFGRATGVDLPGEAAGRVPSPSTVRDLDGHAWRPGDTQSLAIGQGSLTATPLQVVRMMAAVANGGKLVTPHLVSRMGLPQRAEDASAVDDESENSIRVPPPQPIGGLQQKTLAAVREGLQRVVSDPDGTAYGTVRLDTVSVAGKTGTAETGKGRGDHAWFAGYVPAETPKVAFVVVLEHAGDAATTAGPVAKRLVMRMQQLGMF